jgi:hypothetical protein
VQVVLRAAFALTHDARNGQRLGHPRSLGSPLVSEGRACVHLVQRANAGSVCGNKGHMGLVQG